MGIQQIIIGLAGWFVVGFLVALALGKLIRGAKKFGNRRGLAAERPSISIRPKQA